MNNDQLEAMPTLLTTAEAAQILRVSQRFITSLCERGIIKAKKIGRHWKINRDSLREYAGV